MKSPRRRLEPMRGMDGPTIGAARRPTAAGNCREARRKAWTVLAGAVRDRTMFSFHAKGQLKESVLAALAERNLAGQGRPTARSKTAIPRARFCDREHGIPFDARAELAGPAPQAVVRARECATMTRQSWERPRRSGRPVGHRNAAAGRTVGDRHGCQREDQPTEPAQGGIGRRHARGAATPGRPARPKGAAGRVWRPGVQRRLTRRAHDRRPTRPAWRVPSFSASFLVGMRTPQGSFLCAS